MLLKMREYFLLHERLVKFEFEGLKLDDYSENSDTKLWKKKIQNVKN